MIKKKNVQEDDVINDQFVILEKFDNKRHSSKIYKGWDRISKSFVVIKITSASLKEKTKLVTKYLQKLRGGTGIPAIIWRGMIDNQAVTVTECLGPNLKKLFLLMDKRFSNATVAMIGYQLLHTLEYIHKNDIVCCNIMPKEILISLNKKIMTMYITDFKQAKKASRPGTKATDIISHSTNKAILNKFSSINMHLGFNPTKKDDLESLAYILVYFLRGQVFSKGVKGVSKEDKIKAYEQHKLTLVPEEFCAKLPIEISNLITYVRNLQFDYKEELIDYEYCKKLMRSFFHKECPTPDSFQYDWIMKAISKSNKEKNELTDPPLKDESNADTNDITEGPIIIGKQEKKDENKSNVKIPTFLQRVAKLAAENPDNIIFALDKNLGIDIFAIPDEGSESQSQAPSPSNNTTADETQSPVLNSWLINDPSNSFETKIKTMNHVKFQSASMNKMYASKSLPQPSTTTFGNETFKVIDSALGTVILSKFVNHQKSETSLR